MWCWCFCPALRSTCFYLKRTKMQDFDQKFFRGWYPAWISAAGGRHLSRTLPLPVPPPMLSEPGEPPIFSTRRRHCTHWADPLQTNQQTVGYYRYAWRLSVLVLALRRRRQFAFLLRQSFTQAHTTDALRWHAAFKIGDVERGNVWVNDRNKHSTTASSDA